MSQTPITDNVPGADKGTAEGLAAPGRAGAGGTFEEYLQRRKQVLLSLLLKEQDPYKRGLWEDQLGTVQAAGELYAWFLEGDE